jgi:sigma-B regulation protein RsbU (phosphoserine phosphatase)
MNRDSLQYLRHELRTYLNHILGYSEILLEDLKEAPRPALAPDVENIFRESRNIHRVFLDSFYQDGSPLELFDTAAFRRNLFGPLYILLGLSQRLKKLCEDEHADYLLDDVLKISDSGRKILELVDQELHETAAATPGSGDEYRFAMGRIAQAAPRTLSDRNLGRILVVDDNEMNRDILMRHLERQGHQVTASDTGSKALQILSEQTFDLVLLDILMPGLNGYQVLEKMKADPVLREIPVIMISALDETDSVVHCIALGAEDYLPKSFDPILLKARISACLSKKHYRDQEQKYMKALLESQRQLERELAEAADYVKDLLPKPASEGPFQADWIFQPSAKLGGDCFDYHWVEPGKLAIFLLDVSGHGIGAALLSVSVMNVLRSQGLPHTDFSNPAAVLGALNQHFQMETQNNMYFTIWYGVWTPATGDLTYACAGAPPALLVPRDPALPPAELGTPDMIVGVDTDYTYENRSVQAQAGCRLFLFSDGVYEIRKSSGRMMAFREFTDLLTTRARNPGGSTVQAVLQQIRGLAGADHFDDDFSLLEVTLG